MQVYIAELSADAHICAKRNSHQRSLGEIDKVRLFFIHVFSFLKCIFIISIWVIYTIWAAICILLYTTVSQYILMLSFAVAHWVSLSSFLIPLLYLVVDLIWSVWMVIYQQMLNEWEEIPTHMLRLDVRALLQDAIITEVSCNKYK